MLVPLSTTCPLPILHLSCHNFNEHARTQLRSKQIYYAPFEQRINFNPCVEVWVKRSELEWSGKLGGAPAKSRLTKINILRRFKWRWGAAVRSNLRLRKRRIDGQRKRAVIDRRRLRATCSVRDLQTAPHLANIYGAAKLVSMETT